MLQSREDYIKFIYENSDEKDRLISNKEISKGLGVAPPSVSEMVVKLAEDGYVNYIPYQGVNLTKKGRKKAEMVRRKHLVWEYFLSHELGYSTQETHEMAEKLEHATPDHLVKKLEEYIDYPDDFEGVH